MFGTANKTFGATSSFGTFGSTSSTTNSLGLGTSENPMKDVEVQSPPDDTVSALRFSPKADFLIASSWANDVSTAHLFANLTWSQNSNNHKLLTYNKRFSSGSTQYSKFLTFVFKLFVNSWWISKGFKPRTTPKWALFLSTFHLNDTMFSLRLHAQAS